MSLAQQQNLARVFEKIAPIIVTFCQYRLVNDREFRMVDLETHVRSLVPDISPASPCRILRALRQHGWIDYTCVSRRGSRYAVNCVVQL